MMVLTVYAPGKVPGTERGVAITPAPEGKVLRKLLDVGSADIRELMAEALPEHELREVGVGSKAWRDAEAANKVLCGTGNMEWPAREDVL